MAGDTTITVIGNLTDDPELRFTPSGAAVAKFRIASTPRFLDKASGEWKDGDPLFLACTVWRQVAENVAESLHRGSRVIVSGRLRQRSYETKEGEKRTVYRTGSRRDRPVAALRDSEGAEDVAVRRRWLRCVRRWTWAVAAVRGRRPVGDRRASRASSSGGGNFDDEPPF